VIVVPISPTPSRIIGTIAAMNRSMAGRLGRVSLGGRLTGNANPAETAENRRREARDAAGAAGRAFSVTPPAQFLLRASSYLRLFVVPARLCVLRELCGLCVT
jgi:hypothetical protein